MIALRGRSPAAVAQLVEHAVDVERDEHVDVDRAAVAEPEQHLEVAAGHPHGPPAAGEHGPFEGVGLADDVRGMGPLAEVAQVGVAVRADHPALADRAEQAAVVEVGLDAAVLTQVVEHARRTPEDLGAGRIVGLGEHPGQVADLVHRERVAVRVLEPDPLRAAAEDDLLVDVRAAGPGLGEGEPGAAPQVRVQRRRPGHGQATGARTSHPAAAGRTRRSDRRRRR